MLICPACKREFEPSLRFCPYDGTRLHTSVNGGNKSRVGFVVDEKYRLARLIGTGGMAEVYEAQHLFLLKKVAIKFLKPPYASDSSMLERFRREALLVSMISHPNVVAIEDLGTLEDGTLFMIMELLEGETLADAVKRGPLDIREAVDIVIQIGEGIAAAHGKGIIHRDLKPSNVFLVDGGLERKHVKILDLGIAKLLEEGADSSLTGTGIVIGSPNYMPPEQGAGARVDHRSDIYALGIILYELVTGRPTFEAGSMTEIIVKHATVQPTRPSIHAPERNIPVELEQVIMKAIAKKPEGRFLCARDLVDALGPIAAAMGGKAACPPRHPSPRPEHAARGTSGTSRPLDVTVVGHNDNRAGRTETATEIAPGIFWVGRRAGELLERNAYLLRFEGRGHVCAVVVDPGPYCDLQAVTSKISSAVGSLQAIDAIFINHQDPDVAANAAHLQRLSPRAVVWCSEDSWRLSRFYELDPKRYHSVERFWNRSTTLPTGHRLIFVPTPFCHARGAVMLYEPDSRILFSGDFLGGLSSTEGMVGDEGCWPGIQSFHQLYMPSCEAMKNAVAQIRALTPPPLMVAPQHGSLLPASLIGPFLQRIAGLKVGVDLVLTSHSKTNYLRAINELLPEMSAVLGNDRISDTLARFDSDQSFRKLFTIVDNVIVDIRMDPEAAMALLLQRLFSGARDSEEVARAQALTVEVLQRWNLVPPEHI